MEIPHWKFNGLDQSFNQSYWSQAAVRISVLLWSDAVQNTIKQALSLCVSLNHDQGSSKSVPGRSRPRRTQIFYSLRLLGQGDGLGHELLVTFQKWIIFLPTLLLSLWSCHIFQEDIIIYTRVNTLLYWVGYCSYNTSTLYTSQILRSIWLYGTKEYWNFRFIFWNEIILTK